MLPIPWYGECMQTETQTWLERHITLHNYDDAKAERENFLTHAVGAVLALAALVAILIRNQTLTNSHLRWGMIIYGCSMLLLYTASALYHRLPKCDAKRVCRILDHTNIYILIAGTYTPILTYVDTPLALNLLAAIWVTVAVGVTFTLVFWGKLRPLHVILYLVMGWVIVFFWNSVVPYLPAGLSGYILAAGIVYSLGVIFYAIKTIPHYHAIWHLFCIGGSALFFIGFERFLY
jgi:hemolysin III